jgi:hypothetical protein
MANLRRNFLGGKMSKDADERLLQDGEYIHAENIEIINSEGSDVGSVQSCFSNKQLTSINFGTNVETQGKYEDDSRDKIYWWVKSSLGCYILEWDNASQSVAFVLKDTRSVPNRVLNLKSGNIITGIEKIVNDNVDDDLLIWTDNNMDICCINIERAKKYGENGFDIEDITLIKKPPRFAPTATLFYSGKEGNNIEEKFLLFSTRYQYLDNEWSPLSSFTNYKFSPKPYEIDYYTLDNIGMVNAYNAVNIDFNVGDKRVKAVQIITKESNSNNLYIIETFDKEKEGWGDNTTQRLQFSNNKNYKSLPSTELARTYDNVPREAGALTLIDNRLVIGNYLEGYNIADANGKKIKLDYNVSLKSIVLNTGDDFTLAMTNVSGNNTITISNTTNLVLKKGFQITFSLSIAKPSSNVLVYRNSFQYVLDKDYTNLQELFLNSDFISFTNVIINDFALNYQPALLAGETVVTAPVLSIFTTGLNSVGFSVTSFTYNTSPVTTVQTQYLYFTTTANIVSLIESSSSASCKSNRDYEVGIEYIDAVGRETVVLTCPNNSIYIPNEKSEYKNSLSVQINNLAPYFADRFKLVVKTPMLSYYTLATNNFYIDGAFVWIKLEGANIDKVKAGEYLILKSALGVIQNNLIKTKILEISTKEKDFISTSPVVEPEGFYMKIKPNGFVMSQAANEIFSDAKVSALRSGYPTVYLDLHTVSGVKQKLYPGNEIKVKFLSKYHFDAGWSNQLYENTYKIKREYNNVKEWFDEIVLGNDLKGTEDSNYNGKISVVVGDVVEVASSFYVFTDNPAGKEYMKVVGLRNTTSKGRRNYIDASIDIRISTGDYIFETEPKKDIEQNVFFKTEQTFEVIGGNHQGNIQNQIGTSSPCIIDLDYFNCFAQGNGVESYQIKDAFNKPYLNIDNKPTSTITEEYKEIRRQSDLTYAERYVESTNRNGLNEFNQARANFKELDKGFGPITRLISRDSNIIVFQEEKVSQVLYEKDEIKNADGSSSLIAVDSVLGRQIPYMGENGCQHPESIAVYDFQVYYANVLRGVYQRLSIDGVSDIVTGMKSYFRNLFIERPKAKVLGGYDPYFKKYVTSIGEQPIEVLELQCGNIILKNGVAVPFTYRLKINDLSGSIVLNYTISGGNATIEALFNSVVTVVSNVTGSGNLTIPRTSLVENIVEVTVTPISTPIHFEITNNCPVGVPLKVVSIVLGDEADASKSITNRYKWNTTPYYEQIDTFLETPLTRFTIDLGIEGQGKFPQRGSTINIQSYSNEGQLGSFSVANANRLGYLISETIYTDADINTILSLAAFPVVTESIENISNVVNQASFNFAKTTNAQILYLIWDYTDAAPVAVNDNIYTTINTPITFDVTVNDYSTGNAINVSTVNLNPEETGIHTNVSKPEGLWSVSSAGIITFTPVLDFVGEAEITYNVKDVLGNTSNAATITVFVNSGVVVFDADYLVLTYNFPDGRDLDTRSRIVIPNIGQVLQSDYLGWGARSSFPISTPVTDTIPATALVDWAGDNTGTGLESIFIDISKIKVAYPSDDVIVIDCRAFWYGLIGVNPVNLLAKFYKGGAMIKTSSLFSYTNPTAIDTLTFNTEGIFVPGPVNTNAAFSGYRIATFTYTISTNTGVFNISDVTTPSV